MAESFPILPNESDDLSDLTIGSIDFNADDRDELLERCGFLDAGRNHGDIEPVYNNLEQIEAKAWQELATSKVGTEDEGPITHLTEEISETNTKMGYKKTLKERIETELEELRKKKDVIRGLANYGSKPFSALSYFVFLGVLILLTCYLFIFYISAGYSAIFSNFSITKDMSRDEILSMLVSSVLDPNVFSKLEGVGYFLFLLPMVFIGLGLLIHKFVENKQYFWLFLVIIFNFFVDFLFAFSIENKISRLMISMDLPTKPFYFNENFYMVLVLGFGAYLIWGFIYHFFMLEHEKKLPRQAKEQQLKDIQEHMDEKENEILELDGDIASLREKKRQLSERIRKVKDGIISNLNTELLESLLRAYVMGYTKWLNQTGIATQSTSDRIEDYIQRIKEMNRNQNHET